MLLSYSSYSQTEPWDGIPECSNPESFNDPGSQVTIWNNPTAPDNPPANHLSRHSIPCAWTVTTGNSDVSVGIIDRYFPNSAQDVWGPYTPEDPMDTCPSDTDPNWHHGIQSA